MIRHKQLLKPMKNLKNIADPLKYLSLTLLMNLSDLIYKILNEIKRYGSNMSSDIVAYWLLKAATYKSSNTIIEL